MTYNFFNCESDDEVMALFFGAGISFNSGLPLANQIKYIILEQLFDDKTDFSELIESNIPFEVFIDILSTNSDISKIFEIFKNGEPNSNHILVAKLAKIKKIKTILTTNFDLLLEKALEEEGLKEGLDFVRIYKEEDFSNFNYNELKDKLVIFKIHGTIDEWDSIRTTLKFIASKSLSEKRMSIIRYLFSTGTHEKVLILGYSCSDIFDISPQICSIQEEQKEVIFLEHKEKIMEKIEDIKIKDENNPFKGFPGKRIFRNTDYLIMDLWKNCENLIGKYELTKSEILWDSTISDWFSSIKDVIATNYIRGSLLEYVSNFEKAIIYYKSSLIDANNINYERGKIAANSKLGICSDQLGNYNDSKQYYEETLSISRKLKDKSEELKSLINLGNVYLNLGNTKKANEYQIQALSIAEEINDIESLSKIYTNMGILFFNSKDYENAEKFHKKSILIEEEIGDKKEEAKSFINLAAVYYAMAEIQPEMMAIHLKKMEYYLKKSLKLSRQVGYIVAEAKVCNNLGYLYLTLEDPEKAIKCFKISQRIYSETKQFNLLKEVHNGLSIAYNKLR